MQPHLAKSLENNDPPSEAVLSEVKDLLSKPIQELDDKDAEIQQLTQRLKELEDERSVIQKSIEEYSPILSPIRRLPPAILQEIFYHCLPTGRDPVMSSAEAPLLLTYICRSWRSTALAFNRTWAKLYIPLPPYSLRFVDDYDQHPHYQGHIPVISTTTGAVDKEQEKMDQKYAKTMEARRKLVETWLSRSGTCPLSISMKYIGLRPISDDDSDDGHVINQIFDTILSFSQRIEALELSMPCEVYEILQPKISLEMIPTLQNLRINLYEQEPPFINSSTPKSVDLLRAPNLRRLSISAGPFTLLDSNIIPSTWTNLTDLTFHSFITSAEAIEILRRCRYLRRCKLAISNCENVYIDPEDVLLLPRLRFLSIQVGNPDRMAMLYRRINAPDLNEFDYNESDIYKGYSPRYHSRDQLNTYPSPILSLLEKSRKIDMLSLDPRILNPQDILFSCRFANQLTHLILGKRRRRFDSFQHFPPSPVPYIPWSGPGHFNLDLLTIEDDSEDDASNSASGKEILLPKLEVFEAYLNPIHFTDDSLRRFILGRLGEPARLKGISSLRSVKVVFERRMEVDISEEIYRHAKETGREIALHLDYPPKPPSLTDGKYSDIFSPWYGLLSNDRSWDYPDADAESS